MVLLLDRSNLFTLIVYMINATKMPGTFTWHFTFAIYFEFQMIIAIIYTLEDIHHE